MVISNLPQLIILGGTRGSGKNTCADFLFPYRYQPVSFASPIKDTLAWVYDLPRERLEGITPEDRAWREQLHPNLKATTHWDFWSGKIEEAINRMYGPFHSGLVKEYRFVPQASIGGRTIDEAVNLLSAGVSALDRDLTIIEGMQYLGTELFRTIYSETWVNILERRVNPWLKRGARFVVTDGRHSNEAAMARRLGGLVIYIDRPAQGEDKFGNHASEQQYEFRALANVLLENNTDLEGLKKKLYVALKLGEC